MAKYTINRYTLIIFLLFTVNCFAAAPTRSYTYTSGAVINPDEVTTNEDNIYRYLQTGVDTFASGGITSDNITDGTIVNADVSGTAGIVDTKLATISTAGKVSGASLTSLSSIPSGAGSIPSANLGGVALPSGAVFYMMTGSCPSGTTDVTATYSDKFIKVNATQGTTGGATSDSITLTSTELPAHQHALTGATAASNGAHTHTVSLTALTSGTVAPQANKTLIEASETWTVPSAGAHTHTLSGSVDSTGSGQAFTVDTVPPFVTCKMCQVN